MSTSRLLARPSADTGSPSAICVMAATDAAVPALRAFTRRTVHAWHPGERTATEALALIVTELVTNACQHSGSPQVSVHLFAHDRTLGVEVCDNGAWKRPAGDAGPAEEAVSGRGLQLVEAYADTVRIRRSGDGTSVVATVGIETDGSGTDENPGR
ncbi:MULTISPECIES: ATP-binding protein [Streptomyces]|uniref:ATP-binding protein n=1 Tax=Streptomyces doebereineriae TaxID=3075528 RepID=A0ABU2V1I8_9ACTN|nr:ATP-binding protein [Streptomyces sp. DSM 41640]MDT0479420.1 ATP-binding protein [Streptomyces sp. DSM 41640]